MKYAPYSISRIQAHRECPKKFYWKYVERVEVPEPPEPLFFEKGHYFHHILQYFPQVPPETFKFAVSGKADILRYRKELLPILKNDRIRDILGRTGLREHEFTIYQRSGEDSSPYGKSEDAILQGYIDFLSLSPDDPIIIDWKTGRVYEDKSEDQLKLYALWGFIYANYIGVDINKITCSYYYVEHDRQIQHEYEKSDVPSIIQYFSDQINRIEGDTEFPKIKSTACHHCKYFDVCAPFNVSVEKHSDKNEMAS